MNSLKQCFMILFEWLCLWLNYAVWKLLDIFPGVIKWRASSGVTDRQLCRADSEEWKTNEVLRIYHCGDGTMVTVQTSTHAFHVSIMQLSSAVLVNASLTEGHG